MAYLSTEETSAITKNWSSREQKKKIQVKEVKSERFIHEAHSFILVPLYTYLCIYVCLSLRNKIVLSKLEAVVCESYGLLFAWFPLGHYLRELLVKKWYKAHILLG